MKWIIPVALFLFLACNDESKSDCTSYQEPFIQCACTKEYNPVCGCNGKTYGNPCEAECLQVPSYEMGACK